MNQTLTWTCGLGLLALGSASALSAAPELSELRIQVVDGQERLLPGFDLFVYDSQGGELFTSPAVGGILTTHTQAQAVTLVLPELGVDLHVPLNALGSSTLGQEITVRVAQAKGTAQIAAIKPFVLGSTGAAYAGVPANDDCDNAIPIAAGDTAFSTAGATTDSTIGTNFNDIWFSYTAPSSGIASFSTCNQADFDTDLVILTADSTCAAQAALAINDDFTGCGGNTSVLNANVVGGETYLLSLGAFGDDTGSGTLSVSLLQASANDDCANAEPIALGDSVTFNNLTSSNSPSDPPFSCIFNGDEGFGSTWFSFVADSSSALLDTTESMGSTDTVVSVFSGDCANPVEVGCGEDVDFDNQDFLTRFFATGLNVGETYLVKVSTFSEASAGEITLSIESGPTIAPYNGSGVNTATLSMPLPALIGEDVLFEVVPGTGATIVAVSAAQDQSMLPFGEALIDMNFIVMLQSPNGSHSVGFPNNPALIGRTFYAQGFVPGAAGLTNGVEFEVGGL